MNAFWGCGILVIVAGTLVFLKGSWRYLFRDRKPWNEPQASMVERKRIKVEPVDSEQKIFAGSPVNPDARMVVAQEPRFPADLSLVSLVEAVSAPEDELEPIECGKCHNVIQSGYIEIKGTPQGEVMVFQCEHCQTKVAIPA
jgi:hypothetical protein